MKEMTDFENKVVVVTGAARGIGLDTSRALADRGASVIGLDLLPAEDDAPFASFQELDICDAEGVEVFFTRLVEERGHVDGLVNNAATVSVGSFLEASLTDLDRAYAVNLRALFHVAQQAAKRMQPQAGASIVNLASVNGERGVTNTSIYSLTKGGVAALTRTIAVELAPLGIRCNAVAPAPTGTDRVLALLTEEQIATRTSRIPFGRLGRPTEIADAVVFLLSSQSAFVTGHLMPADGGYLAYGS